MRSHISVYRATTKYFSNPFVFKIRIEKEGLPRDSPAGLGAGCDKIPASADEVLALFDWRKEKPKPLTTAIRETLFGDMPLSGWASFTAQTTSEPWSSFERARRFIESRDTQSATTALQAILEIPGLESRHYLQAYHFLADLGVTPIRELSKNVLGVVVEVGMKVGPDLIAGYTDHHARYYNYSGAGVVWERPDGALDTTIDEFTS